MTAKNVPIQTGVPITGRDGEYYVRAPIRVDMEEILNRGWSAKLNPTHSQALPLKGE